MKLVKKEKLCFNCLTKNHNVDKCGSKNKWFYSGCAEYPHTSLHSYFKKKVEDTDEENAKVCIYNTENYQPAFFQIVTVKIKSHESTIWLGYFWKRQKC